MLRVSPEKNKFKLTYTLYKEYLFQITLMASDKTLKGRYLFDCRGASYKELFIEIKYCTYICNSYIEQKQVLCHI